MAIVRCQDHPPRNTNYAIAVKPVGYPETALICGRTEDHDAIGWVYLRQEEYRVYQNGKRVFSLWGPDSSSTAAKVRVSDNIVEGLSRWAEDESTDTSLQSQSSISGF